VIAKPIARPDTTSGNKDVNQVVNLITNPATSGTDSPGTAGVDLDPTSLRLCPVSVTTPTAANCTLTTLSVTGVGTYTVDANGQMTFDPAPNYTGTPAPVKYIVKDEIGQVANSTYTPTVLAPPTVKPDTSIGPQDTAQSRNVITNTVNTGDTANSGSTLDMTSLAIACPSVPTTPLAIAPGLATPASITCTLDADGKVVMAGQGTYEIDSKNPGSIIFTPEPGFTGTATGVKYSITDSNGQVSSTTYTPTVIPAPTARDDYSVAEQGATQWISPIGNDSSSASAKLVPATILLCRAGEPPPDCEATEVVIPGQGTFTVSSFGVVKFVPEPGFTGTVTPLNYQVADSLGQKTDATIFVEVLPPPAPSATMDTGSADFNKPVTLSPWLNDFAGTKPDGSESNLAAPALVPSSIRLCTTVQTPPNCNATRVTTVDGTYVVDTKTGKVVFTPVNGFTGTVTAPVSYQISNNWSGFAGPGVATSILVPTINPPGAPAATVDVTTTKPGVSVVLIPVGNDKPGAVPLDPKTIRLCGATEISPACTQTSVTTLDGTYVVDPKTGHVTFTPRAGFTGKATIPYVISDANGKTANSNLIITVKESAQTPVVKPVVDKPELPKTGGTRPDLLLLLGILALVGAGGLRFAGRKP
jgi:LPXTG-motif cell wall-anchored protein